MSQASWRTEICCVVCSVLIMVWAHTCTLGLQIAQSKPSFLYFRSKLGAAHLPGASNKQEELELESLPIPRRTHPQIFVRPARYCHDKGCVRIDYDMRALNCKPTGQPSIASWLAWFIRPSTAWRRVSRRCGRQKNQLVIGVWTVEDDGGIHHLPVGSYWSSSC